MGLGHNRGRMNTKIRKVYISGPMTGFENFNRPKFREVEKLLRIKGHNVFSPAILPDGFHYDEYMIVDFAMIQCCCTIIMLPGWKRSRGAVKEYHYAQALELDVFYWDNIKKEFKR